MKTNSNFPPVGRGSCRADFNSDSVSCHHSITASQQRRDSAPLGPEGLRAKTPRMSVTPLRWLLLFGLVAALTAHAQLPNPPASCSTSIVNIITIDNIPLYVPVVICSDPADIGPSCPGSGASGNNGGAAVGGNMTTMVYRPPPASDSGRGAEELANIASGPEGEAALDYLFGGGERPSLEASTTRGCPGCGGGGG